MPLGVSGEGAAGLDDIPVASRLGHDHGVEVGLAEETTYDRHGRRDVEAARLANLAFVAGSYEPFDIVDQHRPPEAEKQTSADSEDTLVPKVIVGLLNQSESLVLRHH